MLIIQVQILLLMTLRRILFAYTRISVKRVRDWFYWGFTVSGAAGRNITFEFTKSRAIGVNGPAWSDDQGQSWQWLGVDAVDGNTFTFSFEADVATVQFCMAIPYQWSHWQQFYQQLPAAVINEHKLCTTCHQRDNKYYELTAAKENAPSVGANGTPSLL